MAPSSQVGLYHYGSPESDVLWLITAIGSTISITNEALRNGELSSRIKQMLPFSLNLNTGELTWGNPKFAKFAKWGNRAGALGDGLNLLGISTNIIKEGWTTENNLDLTFGVIGVYAGWGDIAALWYTGMKALVPTEGFQNTTEVWRDYGISPSFRHCFAEGTRVTMGDGTSKNIEDIDVGDTVLTYNFINKKLEINLVLEKNSTVHIKLIQVIFSNKEEVISTEDHPYYVKGKGLCSFNPDLTYQNYGFRTRKMEVSDLCFTPGKRRLKKVKIVLITQIEKSLKTYNLSKIKNSNCFFVNGVLVNNENETK